MLLEWCCSFTDLDKVRMFHHTLDLYLANGGMALRISQWVTCHTLPKLWTVFRTIVFIYLILSTFWSLLIPRMSLWECHLMSRRIGCRGTLDRGSLIVLWILFSTHHVWAFSRFVVCRHKLHHFLNNNKWNRMLYNLHQTFPILNVQQSESYPLCDSHWQTSWRW